MFLAFLESIKYSGHLLPIVFLRVFLGYYYLLQALAKFSGDFLVRPRISYQIYEYLPKSSAPEWYKFFILTWLQGGHWQTLAFILTGFEFAVAISYLIGYVVRPVALMAALLSLQMHYISPPGSEQLHITFVGIHLTMAWIGAGRCVGLDYYFFKRRRGIWW